MEKALAKLQARCSLYQEIWEWSRASGASVLLLEKSPFFERVIECFGPELSLEKVTVDLKSIFDVAFHVKSGSLIIANKEVVIPCLSPFSQSFYLTRHIACSLYHPDLGIESVNIGLVGNVYAGDVILRAESACPPSFLYGSQKCNCHYQWMSIRELAAHFNAMEYPAHLSKEDFEKWVQDQFYPREGKQLPVKNGQGLVLMHLDSQAGMGSGYTEGEFVLDLYNRSLIRHLSENRAEQAYLLSVKEGHECLGLISDGRRGGEKAGYQIPSIVLEWLGVSRDLIVLSNKPFKLEQLEGHGFQVKRVKSFGKIGMHSNQRDTTKEELTFEQEIERLKTEIGNLHVCRTSSH